MWKSITLIPNRCPFKDIGRAQTKQTYSTPNRDTKNSKIKQLAIMKHESWYQLNKGIKKERKRQKGKKKH